MLLGRSASFWLWKGHDASVLIDNLEKHTTQLASIGYSIVQGKQKGTQIYESGAIVDNIQVLPSDLFGGFKWPFQGLSDLHLGDQNVTWKKLGDEKNAMS